MVHGTVCGDGVHWIMYIVECKGRSTTNFVCVFEKLLLFCSIIQVSGNNEENNHK